MRKNFNLLTMPRVIQSESPASWLMRACQLHCCNLDFLFKALRLVPPNDVDIVSYDKVFKRFAHGTDIPPTHLNEISKWFEPLVVYDKAGQSLHKEINKNPYTSFCPHCLGEDKIPYWRPEWRLKFWQVCPKHQCKMVEECPSCGEHQHTNKVNRNLSLDLSERALQYCVHCSADLTQAHARSIMDNEMHDKLIAQDHLLKICRFGKFSAQHKLDQHPGGEISQNPSHVLTLTQLLIVDFHMAYIECTDKMRHFYGFKNAIKKRSFFDLHI